MDIVKLLKLIEETYFMLGVAANNDKFNNSTYEQLQKSWKVLYEEIKKEQ